MAGRTHVPCGGNRPNKRVLVIEDDANILLSLEFVLEREGYEVRTATSGRHGLATMRRDRPDLVILDLMLPDLSGYEVCERARGEPELAKTPILILTARAQDAERQNGLQSGASEYLTKPFRVSDLIHRVAQLVQAGEASR